MEKRKESFKILTREWGSQSKLVLQEYTRELNFEILILGSPAHTDSSSMHFFILCPRQKLLPLRQVAFGWKESRQHELHTQNRRKIGLDRDDGKRTLESVL